MNLNKFKSFIKIRLSWLIKNGFIIKYLKRCITKTVKIILKRFLEIGTMKIDQNENKCQTNFQGGSFFY